MLAHSKINIAKAKTVGVVEFPRSLLTALRFLARQMNAFCRILGCDKQNLQGGSRARFSLVSCYPYVGF
jgi:hypothetical protein